MKALKAFIKPFEGPQRSVKKKINLIFISIQLSEMHMTGEVNGPSILYKFWKFMKKFTEMHESFL